MQCLDCGHIEPMDVNKVLKDELGNYTICSQCESSFDVIVELVNWLVRFDYGSQNLYVYLEELPEDTEDVKLFEMAKKEIEKEGWKLPEKQMIGWETEIW